MFDAHFHWFPGDLLERARQAFPNMFQLRLPFEQIEDSIRVMDDYGIEAALISYSSFLDPVIDAGADRIETYRALNERAAELALRYHGRFLYCAAVEVTAGEEAVPELERAVKDCGCAALGMVTCYDRDGESVFVHDRSFWPLYKKSEELGIPVFVHPVVPSFWRKLPESVQFLATDWGFFLSNHLAIHLMAFGGVFDAFPKLQFIFCQAGGFMPFTFGRSDINYALYNDFPNRHSSDPNMKVARLRDYAGRFYVDLHSMDHVGIRCAVEALGVEHILFGSDYPITPLAVGPKWHLDNLQRARLGGEATHAITTANASRLFKGATKA